MVKAALSFFLLMLWPVSDPALAAAADALLGIWNTPGGKGQIEVFRCGKCYCGKIVRLSEPFYPPGDRGGMGGRPRVDRNNPDPALRQRPALGLEIMRGFVFEGDNRWVGGCVYDPESGNTYKSRLTLKSPNVLYVRGYIGIPLLGRTSVWHRAP